VGPDPDGPADAGAGRRRLLAWAALGVVYVVWGSTYLAIRVAVRTVPPLLMAGVRYVVAGAILYPLAARQGGAGAVRPGRRQWRACAVVGVLLLLGGNGLVSLAETKLPSSLAALLVATVPLWMVVLERVRGGGRLTWPVLSGLALGFAGVGLLVKPDRGHHVTAWAVATVLAASCSWALGSLYARQAPLPARPLLATAMQMLAGGGALLVLAAAVGEVGAVDVSKVSAASAWAVGWLVVAGSILAFSAYGYALRHLPTATVATYAYVNPVVAVFLGWLVLGETLPALAAVGAVAVVAAVALLTSRSAGRSGSSSSKPPPSSSSAPADGEMGPPADAVVHPGLPEPT
jgi:drug/metabolite transporter (DMT)-like permease